ncbi:hypothetical protein ACFSVM_01525 [Paenibacillus shunpengii]|uniref:Uncharacterized protein n=1 Tax=Paenibacillus shunpengii TaxID=2054424 RepID=A0ABW5SHE0_9BACL|nr:hypothetical protein [Paenibacillus sp. PDC88]SDX36509.1 hypothetical protein SAMN05518848_106390 [Paenibacillus sp. PDC88]
MIQSEEEFRRLLAKRDGGKVTYGYELRSKLEKDRILESFIEQMGHNGENVWNFRHIGKAYAAKILTYAISTNMTHNIDLPSKPWAEKLSAYFVDQFQPEVMFYTNGHFDSNGELFKLYSWATISKSKWNTIDTGVIALDNDKIGILWAMDPL